MNRLEYQFDCLDGHYFFTGEWDETLRYEIRSDIEGFNDLEGELSAEKTKTFLEKLNEASIEKWDRHYLPETQGIEDAVRWKVKLVNKDKEYVSEAEESFEPYGYDSLIEALKLIEEKAGYFSAGDE